MKITKTASGKTEVRISKSEWQAIGKQAKWEWEDDMRSSLTDVQIGDIIKSPTDSQFPVAYIVTDIDDRGRQFGSFKGFPIDLYKNPHSVSVGASTNPNIIPFQKIGHIDL